MISALARKSPFTFGIVAFVLVAVASRTVAWEADTRTETCTITASSQVGTAYSRSGQQTSSRNQISTRDCGTLNVDNDPTRLRFGAGSDFASIRPGETVQLTVVGWQGAVFSTLPNVVGVQPAS